MFVDKVGTKKGYSWDRKCTYAIISAFCQKYIPISRREATAAFYRRVRRICLEALLESGFRNLFLLAVADEMSRRQWAFEWTSFLVIPVKVVLASTHRQDPCVRNNGFPIRLKILIRGEVSQVG